MFRVNTFPTSLQQRRCHGDIINLMCNVTQCTSWDGEFATKAGLLDLRHYATSGMHQVICEQLRHVFMWNPWGTRAVTPPTPTIKQVRRSFIRSEICYTPAQRSWRGGILDSPCPSVRPSVCRRHGFRSISQVCFGISISNFICMLMVVIGKSLLIFSEVTFKMAARRPYWIFWFPDSNFSLALNINFKLQRHNTYVYV